MEKCYEYFSCYKKNCPAQSDSKAKCWELENTLCNHPIQNTITKYNHDKCNYCIYKKLTQKKMESVDLMSFKNGG